MIQSSSFNGHNIIIICLKINNQNCIEVQLSSLNFVGLKMRGGIDNGVGSKMFSCRILYFSSFYKFRKTLIILLKLHDVTR